MRTPARTRGRTSTACPRDRQLVELQQIEAVGAGRRLVQPRQADDGDQHQHAAGHRVEDELDRGVDALVVAPDADQEVHRDQHEVPEDVEEEEVERAEDADHRRLEQQHEDRELLDLLLDALPRRQQRDRRQEAGQHEQHQAEAVDADVVLDAERGIHGSALDELERRRRRRRSKPAQSTSVTANATSDTASATLRISASFAPSRLLMSISRSAPMIGARRWRAESASRSIALSPEVIGEDGDHAPNSRRRVGLDRPVLQQPQHGADAADHVAGAVDRAVDELHVQPRHRPSVDTTLIGWTMVAS